MSGNQVQPNYDDYLDFERNLVADGVEPPDLDEPALSIGAVEGTPSEFGALTVRLDSGEVVTAEPSDFPLDWTIQNQDMVAIEQDGENYRAIPLIASSQRHGDVVDFFVTSKNGVQRRLLSRTQSG